MKKITLLSAIAMIAFTSNSFAQAVSTSVETSANVITPIAIAPGNALNFGDIVGTSAGGTVTILADGTDRISSVNDLLIGQESDFSAATFTVTGQAGYGFDITLPAEDFVVTNETDELATMSVGSFTSTPTGSSTLVEGTATIIVGATLSVGVNQGPGTYTNEDGMKITVQYN